MANAYLERHYTDILTAHAQLFPVRLYWNTGHVVALGVTYSAKETAAEVLANVQDRAEAEAERAAIVFAFAKY